MITDDVKIIIKGLEFYKLEKTDMTKNELIKLFMEDKKGMVLYKFTGSDGIVMRCIVENNIVDVLSFSSGFIKMDCPKDDIIPIILSPTHKFDSLKIIYD